MIKKQKNILITGSHRSGSTWFGKVLTCTGRYVYVDEPFNIGKTHIGSPLKNQFEYLPGKDPEFQKKTKTYLNSFNAVFLKSNVKKMLQIRSVIQARRFLMHMKSRTVRPYVYKDPLALLSAEWIYKEYGWDVVVLVRHPAAFVASLKVKDWQFYFHYFLNQEQLMKEHLQPYATKIEEYSKERPNIIKQGILLWNILYSMVVYFQKKYNEKWYFVTHEALSLQPIDEFKKVYDFLNIEFDTTTKSFIEESTSSKEKSLLKRDSKQNINSWKERLTKLEIAEIKNETEEVWKYFYNEEDW